MAVSESVGLDTSAVLRLLTGEPAAQAERALNFVQETVAGGAAVVVGNLVVSEAYFALHHHYGVPKREAIQTLLRLFEMGPVQPEPRSVIVDVLRETLAGGARPGFLDRLIHASYAAEGCRLATSEKAAARLSGSILMTARK